MIRKPQFLDLHLLILTVLIHLKSFNKRDDFDFYMVNFQLLDGLGVCYYSYCSWPLPISSDGTYILSLECLKLEMNSRQSVCTLETKDKRGFPCMLMFSCRYHFSWLLVYEICNKKTRVSFSIHNVRKMILGNIFVGVSFLSYYMCDS